MKPLLVLCLLVGAFTPLLLPSCASLWPTPVAELTVERSTIDPPAAAILERVRAYAEADEHEDPRILPTAWTLYSALASEKPMRVAPWEPLSTDGLILVYYRERTLADPTLAPETAQGRVLAAELLGEALERVLAPPAPR